MCFYLTQKLYHSKKIFSRLCVNLCYNARMDMDFKFSTTEEHVQVQLEKYRQSLNNQIQKIENLLGEPTLSAERVCSFFTDEVASSEAIAYSLRQGIGVSYSDILPERIIEYGSFVMLRECGCYHFVMDRLLQKRITNLKVKSDSYSSIRSAVMANYKYNLIQCKKHVDVVRFNEPVWLVFIHHYKSNREVRDFDNFEYKAFIDTVIVDGGFVYDDAPQYISHLSCSCMKDQKSYTEVFLGPLESIIEIKGEVIK